MVWVDSPEGAQLECQVCRASMPALSKFCGKCGAPRAVALGGERPLPPR